MKQREEEDYLITPVPSDEQVATRSDSDDETASCSWDLFGIEGDKKNSPISTTVLLLNSMIGSGILIQAYVFLEAGILVVFAEYILVGIITFYGVDLLIRSGDRLGIYDFGVLAKAALGYFGDYLVDGSIFVSNSGALISYVIIIGTLGQSVILTYTTSAWYSNVAFLAGLIVGLFVAPVCLIPRFGRLALISYLSIFAVTGTMLLVMIGGPLDSAPYSGESLNLGNFMGSIETIGSVVFAFSYSPAIFHAYIAMSPQKVPIFSNVLFATTCFGVIMCFIVGLAGYLSFRNSTDADILLDFSGTVGAVFKTAIVIHLIFYIPGDFIIARYSLFRLFGLQVDELSDLVYFVSTMMLLGVLTATACLLQLYLGSNEAFSLTLNITGGLGASITSFIVPGLIGMEVMKDNTGMYYRSMFIVVCGVIIQVLVLVSIAITAISGNTDDDA